MAVSRNCRDHFWRGLRIMILSCGLTLSSAQAEEFEFWQAQTAAPQECQPGVIYQRNAQGVCVPLEPSESQPKQNLTKVSQLSLAANVLPSCFAVKGQASTEGVSSDFAQKMAIRDALKNATMQRNVEVDSDITLQNQSVLLENERFVSRSHVQSYVLLKAGLEEPYDMYGQDKPKPLNYEVELEVCLSSKRGICPDLNGRRYFPSVLVAPLAVEDIAGAHDLRNLVVGYQQELQRRLQDAEQKNTHLLKRLVDIQENQRITPNLDDALLDELYDETGAQYLLLSVLRSALSRRENQGLGTQIQRYYNRALEEDSRYLEVDWYLVDLLDKQVVHEARNGFDVRGDVRVSRDRLFGTNAFFATDTGKAFDQLLSYQSADVIDYLHCKHFASKVIDVRDGKYYLFLNAQSGVQVGDDLAVYHRIGAPLNVKGRSLGSEYEPGAFLKVIALQANFAVAQLSSAKNVVQIGDLVRPW